MGKDNKKTSKKKNSQEILTNQNSESETENQNQGHNSRKEALGQNTKR